MQNNLAQQSNNDNSDFLPGDVVVYMNHIKIDALKTVEAFQPNEYYWLVCGQLVHRDDIRSANVAELDAGKCLGGRV